MMCWDQFLRFVNSDVVLLALTELDGPRCSTGLVYGLAATRAAAGLAAPEKLSIKERRISTSALRRRTRLDPPRPDALEAAAPWLAYCGFISGVE
jgi:hypothetical protein